MIIIINYSKRYYSSSNNENKSIDNRNCKLEIESHNNNIIYMFETLNLNKQLSENNI